MYFSGRTCILCELTGISGQLACIFGELTCIVGERTRIPGNVHALLVNWEGCGAPG